MVDDALAAQLPAAVRDLGVSARSYAMSRMSVYGLARLHGVVLRVLGQTESATHAELAAACRVEKSNITGAVDRLVVRGLVTRDRSPEDRRVWRVSLTDQGRELLPKVEQIWADLGTIIAGDMTKKELQRWVAQMQESAARLQSAQPGHWEQD